jgi:hypothetical protein
VDALQIVVDIPNELIAQWNDYVRLVKDALAHAAGALPSDVFIGPSFLEDPKLPQSADVITDARRRELLQAKHHTSYYIGIAYPRTQAGAVRRKGFEALVTSSKFYQVWYPYAKLRRVGTQFNVKGTKTVPRVKKANMMAIESSDPYKAPSTAAATTAPKKNIYPGGVAPGTAPAVLGGGWGNAAGSGRRYTTRTALLQLPLLALLLGMLWAGFA